MNLDGIISLRDDKEKELMQVMKDKATVDEEYGKICIEIAQKEVRKKELSIARDKARSAINVLRVELEHLKNMYFNARGQ